MTLDAVVLLNLTFDVVIALLAVFFNQKTKNTLVAWIAGGFALFAVSYLLTIADITSSWVLVPIRAVGYLSVVLGLVLAARRRP